MKKGHVDTDEIKYCMPRAAIITNRLGYIHASDLSPSVDTTSR